MTDPTQRNAFGFPIPDERDPDAGWAWFIADILVGLIAAALILIGAHFVYENWSLIKQLVA